MKYTVKYDCGCKKVIELFGPCKDRENTLNWLATQECPDCKRKAEQEAAAKEAAEQGLPDLVGTEKQVAWAMTIRAKALAEFNQYLRSEELMQKAYSINSAKWWIDTRNYLLRDYRNALLKMIAADEEFEYTTEKANEAYLTKTDDCTKKYVVKIAMSDTTIYLDYPEKDSTFLDVMHKHQCEWTNKKWTKTTSAYTAPITDCVAEIGAMLLKAGFMVEFPTKETMDKAVSGDYEKTCYKWVTVDENQFYFKWSARDDKIYNRLRAIKGSRYERPCVTVPLAKWRDVVDAAEELEFTLSEEAKTAIDKAEAKEYHAFRVAVNESVQEQLKKDETIIEDLVDEFED